MRRGLTVLALCPGNTSTNFAEAANADVTRMTRAETPERVVEEGLKAFLKGRNYVIPGRSVNYLLANSVSAIAASPRAWDNVGYIQTGLIPTRINQGYGIRSMPTCAY